MSATSTDTTQDILAPFIQLAHSFRNGDAHSIERTLTACNLFLEKYLVIFQDKATLTEILANINETYQRRDHVSLADIYEYEMTAYLKAEIENFSQTGSANNKE